MLFTETLRRMMVTPTQIKSVFSEENTADGPSALVAGEPLFYGLGMKFFYWGIQVGRELAKDESATLDKIGHEG